jgi:hypothetical protein
VLWPLPLDRAQARALSHIEASHAAGELTTLIYRNTNGDFDIARDEAIRWAVARRELFLDFPFSIDDVPAAARSAVGARADLDKPLEQRERKTLYSIIDALAHKAGIDVSIPSRAGLERPQIKQRPVQRLNSRPRCMATLLGAAR